MSHNTHHRTIGILLAILAATALPSCRTARTTERETHTALATRDTLHTVTYIDRTHTDTIRDSVYIREIVTTDGIPIYKERNTTRDHRAQTDTKHDTVYIEKRNTAKADTVYTKQKSAAPSQQRDITLPCALICAFIGIVIFEYRNKT